MLLQPLAVIAPSVAGDERLPVLADGPRDLPAHSDVIVIQGAIAANVAQAASAAPAPMVAVGYR